MTAQIDHLATFWKRFGASPYREPTETPTLDDIETLIADLGGDEAFAKTPSANGVVALMSQLNAHRSLALAKLVHAHFRSDLPSTARFAAQKAGLNEAHLLEHLTNQLERGQRRANECIQAVGHLLGMKEDLQEEIADARTAGQLRLRSGMLMGELSYDDAAAQIEVLEQDIQQKIAEAAIHLTSKPELSRFAVGY